ncbi:uncharacterized protein AMSG_02594 [Thecamonas trahens ATCC 50062]|uniref:Bifunctional lysine-specific demethylase and histidyl-hydroxylase n=1 Tax=Thecamonas trahens ATCC 50062 TaxID=461836 RepID=A0A0L0D5G3_THETB|nr:hypothetical protein AMSG_02594 [Thecamonas trahens ATCC 50062]KNC47569.1 hypothetical protein AMSG_02594 [Thecamonas trahens ATCC 50062]|eukprot:XP_013759501.1 hypothetical protein AMSG_02594 [Thecamonas trahens ATCC 50062]
MGVLGVVGVALAVVGAGVAVAAAEAEGAAGLEWVEAVARSVAAHRSLYPELPQPVVARRAVRIGTGGEGEAGEGSASGLTVTVDEVMAALAANCSTSRNASLAGGPLVYGDDVALVKRVIDKESGEPWSAMAPVEAFVADPSVVPPAGALRAAVDAGFSLVFNRIHKLAARYGPVCELGVSGAGGGRPRVALAETAARIAATLRDGSYDGGAYEGANLYWSPAGSPGFETHFDVMDVLVVHIAGAKTWRVYQPQVALPLPGDKARPAFESLEVIGSFTLAPGDVLFLPRGFPHDAEATADGPSVHITFGFDVYNHTWAALAAPCVAPAAASILAASPLLRTTPTELLPPSCVDGGLRDVQCRASAVAVAADAIAELAASAGLAEDAASIAACLAPRVVAAHPLIDRESENTSRDEL